MVYNRLDAKIIESNLFDSERIKVNKFFIQCKKMECTALSWPPGMVKQGLVWC